MPVAAYYLHDPAAPKPNSPTRMGTNVLLECRGRLLLEQRWDCGAWGLPGGRLRRGESEAHGIARELFEETGLRLPEAAFTRVRVVDGICEYRRPSPRLMRFPASTSCPILSLCRDTRTTFCFCRCRRHAP